MADKGYASNKLKLISRKYKFRLIYPNKKYKYKKLKTFATNKLKTLYKKRIVVENCFCWYDKFRRLILRYDKSINSYENFTYLASLIITHKKLK